MSRRRYALNQFELKICFDENVSLPLVASGKASSTGDQLSRESTSGSMRSPCISKLLSVEIVTFIEPCHRKC